MPPLSESSPHPVRRRRRGIVVVAAVLAAFGLLAGGWFAAGTFRSPSQVAAAASAPPPSKVTAQVSLGDLRDDINVQGTVRRELTENVTLTAGDEALVVTKTNITAGSEVKAGALVLEANGKPVFALPGSFPLYRDIALGDSGTDVQQLQEGLRQAGFSVSTDGVLGASTRAAVERLYSNAGYRAPSAGVTVVPTPPTTPQTNGSTADTTAQSTPPAPTLVVVDKSSFVFFRSAPAFLTSAPPVGAVGEHENFVTLTSGSPIVAASVTSSTAASLTLQMTGLIPLTDGTTADVQVTSIGTAGEDGNVPITLISPSGKIPAELLGQDVVVTLTRQLVSEGTLIVPTRAIASHGSGTQVVMKSNEDGSFSEVLVREIAALGGRSAIELNTEGELKSGDEVMVE